MQRDIVMRWISQISAIVARLLRRDPTLSLELARLYLQEAEAEVLGHLADLIPRLDAESAIRLLQDPYRIYGYAQTLALQSALARAAGDTAAGDALAARALAMGEEAAKRVEALPDEWAEWLAAARDTVSREPAPDFPRSDP